MRAEVQRQIMLGKVVNPLPPSANKVTFVLSGDRKEKVQDGHFPRFSPLSDKLIIEMLRNLRRTVKSHVSK
jgi:hypothetical protein